MTWRDDTIASTARAVLVASPDLPGDPAELDPDTARYLTHMARRMGTTEVAALTVLRADMAAAKAQAQTATERDAEAATIVARVRG